ASQRQVVGMVGRGEVVVEALACAGFQALEERTVVHPVGPDVEVLRGALEEHPVARVERDELELVLDGGAEEVEEPLEDLGHEIPRGTGVEPEAVLRPAADAAAELLVLLEQVDAVAARRKERGRGEAGDAAADHDDATGAGVGALEGLGVGEVLGHGRPLISAPAASRSLTADGTRTRWRRIWAAGVRRRRAPSSPKVAWAARTARRLLGGRCGSAAAAAARSSSTSSMMRSRSASPNVSAVMPGK